MAVTPLSYPVSERFPQPFSIPLTVFYDSTILFFFIYVVPLKNLLHSPFCIAGPKYVCQRRTVPLWIMLSLIETKGCDQTHIHHFSHLREP